MAAFSQFISQLHRHLLHSLSRFGLVIRGDRLWSESRIVELQSCFAGSRCLQLGGKRRSGFEWIEFKRGRHVLGQECHLLVVDLSAGFDADSFNAVLGTLVGGGVLVFVCEPDGNIDLAQLWFRQALDRLLVISQGEPLPKLPAELSSLHPDLCYQQQKQAIEKIVRVVEGHRRRPLVLTADRGRGKSSAMGIAAATLILKRNSIKILVTAPSFEAVSSVFIHAQRLLGGVDIRSRQLLYQQSQLVFIAPDELLANRPDCHLLLIDEASAIPISMLQRMAEYSRVVFSSTIHGYEGCGRGFTLKFLNWLTQYRPECRQLHLSQPIRWSSHDWLETWQYETFLLHYELPKVPEAFEKDHIVYRHVPGERLIQSPTRLSEIFSLLVNAHYQTSPNDLMAMLSDKKISVFVAEIDGCCIGCILGVEEGPLDYDVIERIEHGKHRPKGHLVPVTLINQLGISQAALFRGCRIMRIVIHPELHRKGLGTELLQVFIAQCDFDYIATSFGATSDLLNFWQAQKFCPIKIGSQRDHTSGCYSVLMMYQNHETWFSAAQVQFAYYFMYTLKTELSQLEPPIVRFFLSMLEPVGPVPLPLQLIRNYAQGGANYESVAIWTHALVVQHSKLCFELLDDVLIAKVLQNRSWEEVASLYGLSGRKQIENRLRDNILQLLEHLQCKLV
jgi:tRNA(Met) cytidine acetyltransferase